jgi:hypothetical protein
MLIPHIKTVKQVAVYELFVSRGKEIQKLTGYHAKVIDVYAIANSLENTENWNNTFQQIVEEIKSTLLHLTLPIKISVAAVNNDASSKQTDSNNDASTTASSVNLIEWNKLFPSKSGSNKKGSNNKKNSNSAAEEAASAGSEGIGLKGVAKALYLNLTFHILCQLLSKIFDHGCSSGLVSFDLTEFIQVLSKLLGFQLPANAASDPAVRSTHTDQLIRLVNFSFSLYL